MDALPGGGYVFSASAVVPVAPADLAAWLLEPPRLGRWLIGIDAVEAVGTAGVPVDAVGARIRARMVVRGSWRPAFVGELTERSGDRVTRRYRPESAEGDRAIAAVRLAALSGATYQRTVRHRMQIDLAGTALTTEVAVAIPGMAVNASRMAARAEQRSLRRALARLAVVASGGRPGVLARVRDAAHTPQLL